MNNLSEQLKELMIYMTVFTAKQPAEIHLYLKRLLSAFSP
jgi:hypothetical protein